MEEEIQEKKKSSKTLFIAVGITVIIILAGVGYYSHKVIQRSTQSSSQVKTPTVASTEKTFTVQGKNFSFNPNTITVKKGDTVKITFTDDEGFHDLVVDGYNVKTQRINSGASAEVTFVASKAGTFAYYCSVGKHRELGMQGTLIVQ